jgi:hypothetical protein
VAEPILVSRVRGVLTFLTDREAEALTMPWWRLLFAPQATWRARARALTKVKEEIWWR